MAEIGEMPIHHVVNGKLKTTSFDERSMMRMFVDAANGDPKAAADIMTLLNQEEEAAIKRGPRMTRSTKEKAGDVAAFRAVVGRYLEADAIALAKLIAANAIHHVGGTWYVREWAVKVAQENRRQRLRRR